MNANHLLSALKKLAANKRIRSFKVDEMIAYSQSFHKYQDFGYHNMNTQEQIRFVKKEIARTRESLVSV